MATFYVGNIQIKEELAKESLEDLAFRHVATCLSSDLRDHHNRVGELLIGIWVTNQSVDEAVDEILGEIRERAFEIDVPLDTLDAIVRAAVVDVNFVPDDDEGDNEDPAAIDNYYYGDRPQAYFVLSWRITTCAKGKLYVPYRDKALLYEYEIDYGSKWMVELRPDPERARAAGVVAVALENDDVLRDALLECEEGRRIHECKPYYTKQWEIGVVKELQQPDQTIDVSRPEFQLYVEQHRALHTDCTFKLIIG